MSVKNDNMMHKKLCISIFIIFIFYPVFSQRHAGKAIYKYEILARGEPSAAVKQNSVLSMAMNSMNKNMNKEFTLEFNKNSSLYYENPTLNNSASKSDILYKGLHNSSYLKQTEWLGKRFLIKDSLINYNWQLLDETKEILSLSCFKAKTTIKIKANQFFKESRDFEVIAWYAPQIGVSTGPAEFFGLPGLIIAIVTEGYTVYCTKIELSQGKSIKIKVPNKGEVVTEKVYDSIIHKKLKEMIGF